MVTNYREDWPFDTKKEFIKSFYCIMPNTWGHKCGEGLDECHLTYEAYAGFNMKDDNATLPMCRVHHSIQTAKGEAQFYKELLLEAVILAKRLNEAYLTEDLLHAERGLKEWQKSFEKSKFMTQ